MYTVLRSKPFVDEVILGVYVLADFGVFKYFLKLLMKVLPNEVLVYFNLEDFEYNQATEEFEEITYP